MHERERCRDEAANHQLPIATAFWITWIVSAEEYSSLMQNLMRVCYSTHPVILNVTATQYTCSLIGVYGPRPLLTSTVKSPLFTHACSCPFSLVPGYIDAAQSILVLLTMAGLFLDRPVYDGIIPSGKKRMKSSIYNNVNGPRGYYAKWKKLNKKRQISYGFIYMWNLRKQN